MAKSSDPRRSSREAVNDRSLEERVEYLEALVAEQRDLIDALARVGVQAGEWRTDASRWLAQVSHLNTVLVAVGGMATEFNRRPLPEPPIWPPDLADN